MYRTIEKLVFIVKKSIFPDELFQGLDKKDAIIAIASSLIFLFISFIELYLIKNSYLFVSLKKDETMKYHILFDIIMDIPMLVILLIILKFRKQSVSTIGLRKKGLKSSFFAGIVLLAIILFRYFENHEFNLYFLNRMIHYFIFVGFTEEVFFRGFLWPRYVAGFGKIWGTIISGAFFGIMHAPIQVVFDNKNFFDVAIVGHTSSINMGGGIIGSLLFIYIYTRNDNIILPTFIHGILDMM